MYKRAVELASQSGAKRAVILPVSAPFHCELMMPAQQKLEAEQSKFEVGMSTNYFVVQFQRDLATAQNVELQAVLAYRRSVVEL